MCIINVSVCMNGTRLLKLIGLFDHIVHSVFCRHHVVATGSKGAVLEQEGEHFLGMFSQESAAARACDVAALKLHGASAQTNFPARLDSCSLARLPSSLRFRLSGTDAILILEMRNWLIF